MRRLLTAIAVCLICALAAPAASPAYLTGISDQQASTFTNPLYQPLHMKIARYIAPWDVMTDPPQAARLSDWISNASAAHQQILLAFEHSYVKGRQKVAPSIAKYTKALKLFKKAYPRVKNIQPWNEANRCNRTLTDGNVVGQPTALCRKPKVAAGYYNAAVKVFRGAKVTGLDVLDGSNVKPSVVYVRGFLKYAKPRPRYWGFHNYSDTNRFSTKRTAALLKATRSGEVWLTETGGITKFGSSFPFDTARAARALGCMFTLAKANRRIKRLYIYQFNGASADFSFDAGLINEDGSARPGYEIVRKRKARACKK